MVKLILNRICSSSNLVRVLLNAIIVANLNISQVKNMPVAYGYLPSSNFLVFDLNPFERGGDVCALLPANGNT